MGQQASRPHQRVQVQTKPRRLLSTNSAQKRLPEAEGQARERTPVPVPKDRPTAHFVPKWPPVPDRCVATGSEGSCRQGSRMLFFSCFSSAERLSIQPLCEMGVRPQRVRGMPRQQGSPGGHQAARAWRADIRPVRRQTPRDISRRHKNMVLPEGRVRTAQKVLAGKPGPPTLTPPASGQSNSGAPGTSPPLRSLPKKCGSAVISQGQPFSGEGL